MPPGVNIEGDPSGINALNRGLTELGQQMTGISKVLSATTKADIQKNQAEINNMNNFNKNLDKILKALVRNQRTN